MIRISQKITATRAIFIVILLMSTLIVSVISAAIIGVSEPQAVKGDKGDTGAIGATGAMGPTGPAGASGAAGATGVVGPMGATGAAGDNGATWLNGSGVPAPDLGVNGDFYLNLANCDVYNKFSGVWTKVANIQGPIGATGVVGPMGATGAAGDNGATWLNGSGVPAPDLGVNGDFYLNLANCDVYNKFSGVWTKVANIQGPIGATGLVGAKGDTGQQGPPGPQGPYLPDYDSGWIDISDKADQYVTLSHNLNSDDILVDITGKASADGGVHQKYLGGFVGYIPTWQGTFGGTGSDNAQCVVQTSDGGYVLVGSTDSFGAGGSDVYLVKTGLVEVCSGI